MITLGLHPSRVQWISLTGINPDALSRTFAFFFFLQRLNATSFSEQYRTKIFDDFLSAAEMGGKSCPTGRANFVSTKK
jgi:hypothetical protein